MGGGGLIYLCTRALVVPGKRMHSVVCVCVCVWAHARVLSNEVALNCFDGDGGPFQDNRTDTHCSSFRFPFRPMVCVVLLLLLPLLTSAQGFYYQLDAPVCFVEEAGRSHLPDPSQELVHVHYKCPKLNPRNRGVHAEDNEDFLEQLDREEAAKYYLLAMVRDPEGAVIHHEVLRAEEASFSFLTSAGVDGEYHICLEPSERMRPQKSRLWVEIEAARNTDYDVAETHDSLTKKHDALRRVQMWIADAVREIEDLKLRQQPLIGLCDRTHFRVWCWSVLQACILVALMAWQTVHIRAFLKTKKVV